jgi:ligand-binding sensor domain-containing protein
LEKLNPDLSPRILFLAIAASWLSSFFLQAQPVKQYYFTHYTTESGLVSTEVNSVLQDDNGYIWVGTVDGLQRFDGSRFKTFQHNTSAY